MSLEKGYIKLYRSVFDAQIWCKKRVFSEFEAWVWLLSNAHFGVEERIVQVAGQSIGIRRGQLLITYRTLAKEWNWSVGTVQRYLTKLEQSDTLYRYTLPLGGGTLINIANYEKYNSLGDLYDTGCDTPSLEKRYTLRYIKEEYIRYIEKTHKEETHTSLIDLLRGVWGEKESPFVMIAGGKAHQVSVEFFCSYCAAMVDWLHQYAPAVATIKGELSVFEFQKLTSTYDLCDISRIFVDMQNSKSIRKRTSVYATFVSYAARDFILTERAQRIATNDHYRSARSVCKERGIISIIDYRNAKFNDNENTK